MLAIVIPYYKHTFFESTLLSLKNQTNKQFTVYIGDDASPKDPKDLLEKYKENFSCHYKRFDYNLGSISLVKQWERCIAMTNNEDWIMILGDDDELERDFIQSFYDNISNVNELNVNVIRFASQKIDENSLIISKKYDHPNLEKSTDFLIKKIKGETRSSLSEYVFRREILEKIKFKDFPLAWHSDDLSLLEFSNFGYIYTINESLVLVRSSSINISSKSDNLKPKNKASINFYHYLLKYKRTYFDKNQLSLIYEKFEKAILNDKKNVAIWIRATKMYIYHFKIKELFKLYLKAIIRIIKSKK